MQWDDSRGTEAPNNSKSRASYESLNREVSIFGPTQQGGISLVEIMVALTLSLALTGAL